jgi:apolipoprotein N-acyltransferase
MVPLRIADKYRLAFAFLSGLLLALAFPNCDLPWLAWLGPGVTLALAVGQSGKRAFVIGCAAGLGRYLVSLYWFLCIPVRVYAVAAWLAMCLVLALFVGAWTWLCWRTFPARAQRPNGGSRSGARTFLSAGVPALSLWPAFCAAAWVAMEMGFAHVLTGFPWNLLGASQYRFLPLIQVASLTGVYGVSFIIVWVSVSGAALACALSSPKPARAGAQLAALPLIALAAVLAFGFSRLASPDPAGPTLRVALVQPSIPQRLIWDPNEVTNRLDRLVALSRVALAQQPHLLVWPEAAIAGTLARTRATQDLVTGLLRGRNTWMIFGAEDSGRRTRSDGTQETAEFNSAFLVNPAGDLASRYYKRHLVAFGEFMPGARWLPFLKRFRERGGGFASGPGPVLFRMDQPRARISTLICFEDLFPHLARESVTEDTDLLLNLTNNGWFGESATQWQHAAGALFRAVENGLPLIRCTNNGLTCWVDARGRMHEVYFPGSRNIYQPGVKLANVPLPDPARPRTMTFYHRHGDWFGWTCVTITAAVVAWSWRPGQRRQAGTPSSVFGTTTD